MKSPIKVLIRRSDGTKIESDNCRAIVVSYFNSEGKSIVDIDGSKSDILQLVMYSLHLVFKVMDKSQS